MGNGSSSPVQDVLQCQVQSRAGLISNLQPVTLYALVYCRCEIQISNNTSANMKLQKRKKKEKKKEEYGCTAKVTLGNLTLSLFWILCGSDYPRLHGAVDEQHICHSHRHLTDRITVFRVSFADSTFRGKWRELTVKIQRPRTNRIRIRSIIIIHCVSKSTKYTTWN